ncbi:diguanylate cyclase [Neptuniibacter sp. QD48_11]|uniref:diguanylate cyclase n=1 Tax=Neptuniibacter sp. QD48_11 TaxID=3398211 RepID=UPI0039F62BD3
MSNRLNDTANLYNIATRRYLLAVVIIALLATSAYYTLHSALSDSEATAYVVNLSGRQRMLSQHIALDVHRYHHQSITTETKPKSPSTLMLQNLIDMRLANKQLSSGVLSEDQVIDLSPQLREMYFGQMDLHNRVNRYLDLAEQLYKSNQAEERLAYLESIDQTSPQLLIDLNKVVQQYQLEGENRLATISNLELLVLVTTLIALILEVLFIFRPMVAQLMASQKAQAKTMARLEEMVELRTLKLEMANRKLKELATRDPLTELKNRLTLESDVERLIEVSEKNHVPFAFCMVDIDWFKQINDTYGHPAGDYVLKRLASLMMGVTRDYDHLYRTGGEEFVLVLNRVNLNESIKILDQLRTSVEEHVFDFEGQMIKLTISVGLYHTSQDSLAHIHSVARAADNALYRAKESGRNCIRVADREDLKGLQ